MRIIKLILQGLRSKKLLEVIKALFILSILSLVLRWLIPTLTSGEFKTFVEKLGPFGPLVVISYTILSHVFAPLAGTPGILLSVAVFGIYQTMFYLYLASMASASINFYISRKFGKRWVTRLVGKKTMNEINSFVEVSGTQILILSRVFGFTLFEVVSYAFGLTNISFRRYIGITAVFTLIPNLTFTFLFRDTDFSSGNNLVLWLGTLIVTGLIFSVFIKMYLKKRK